MASGCMTAAWTDDLVLGKDNKADEVIVSVGGFLGIGSKLVAVPYTQLKLGDTKNASSDNRFCQRSSQRLLVPGGRSYDLLG